MVGYIVGLWLMANWMWIYMPAASFWKYYLNLAMRLILCFYMHKVYWLLVLVW